MENNKKKETNTIEMKDALMILGGGLFMASALGISYGLGCKFTELKIGYGIEKCCKVDPTLEEHLWNALNKVKELKK